MSYKVYDDFEEMISDILRDQQPGILMTRDRPYNGQKHTYEGESGKQLVEGLTLRDIADCIAKGFLSAYDNEAVQEGVRTGTWQYSDLYSKGSYDPIAGIQNAIYEIKQMVNGNDSTKDDDNVL